jgi:hypothetical protein
MACINMKERVTEGLAIHGKAEVAQFITTEPTGKYVVLDLVVRNLDGIIACVKIRAMFH